MKKGIYWFSWLAFFLSAFVIVLGGLIELRHGEDLGLLCTFAGFIGLALSGLIMTIAYGVPEQ